MDATLHRHPHGDGILARVEAIKFVMYARADLLGHLRILQVDPRAHKARHDILFNLVLHRVVLVCGNQSDTSVRLGLARLVVLVVSVGFFLYVRDVTDRAARGLEASWRRVAAPSPEGLAPKSSAVPRTFLQLVPSSLVGAPSGAGV